MMIGEKRLKKLWREGTLSERTERGSRLSTHTHWEKRERTEGQLTLFIPRFRFILFYNNYIISFEPY